MSKSKRYIISLGGSLIVPDEIDVKYLFDLRVLLSSVSKQYSFYIAPGGGKTARKYSVAASALGQKNQDELDWLGIYAIRLNRLLLNNVFKKVKNVQIIDAANAVPGQSSDAHVVYFAKKINAQAIINLSNVDYVYDKNPKTHKDAKLMIKISWQNFKKIVGSKWKANQSWPFDPTAARSAQKSGLKVIFLNGKRLKNFKNFLQGRPFKGTTIG